MIPNAEIVNLTTVCQTFPEMLQPQIYRENYLNEISAMFEEVSIVTVDGQEGAGKTTLLAQFAQKNPEHAISLFIGADLPPKN